MLGLDQAVHEPALDGTRITRHIPADHHRTVPRMTDVLGLIGMIAWSVLLGILALARFGPPLLKRLGCPASAEHLQRFRHVVRRYAVVGVPDEPRRASGTEPRRET